MAQETVYTGTSLEEAEMQYGMAQKYSTGWAMARNEAKATQLYTLAAEAGLTKAMLALGIQYACGFLGVPNTPKEATRWLWPAARAGYGEAYFWLGTCYDKGIGVEKDEAMAARCYRDATLAPSYTKCTAYYSLGKCYEHGRGVAQDIDEAFLCYTQAALQGDKTAEEARDRCKPHPRTLLVAKQVTRGS